MAVRRLSPALAAVLLASLALPAAPARAEPAAVPARTVPGPLTAPPRLHPDLPWIALSLGAIAVSSRFDRGLAEETPEFSSPAARDLSHGFEKLGNGAIVAPALALTWGAARLGGHDALASATLRVAGGVAATVLLAGGAKYTIGRARPYQAPGDPGVFRPFSGNNSFPSGHTAVAFALASGIDRETHARWVPWVVYPMAGMVGWSRMRDQKHWMSDVVGGAALAIWTTGRFEELVSIRAQHAGHAPTLGLEVMPGPDGPETGIALNERF